MSVLVMEIEFDGMTFFVSCKSESAGRKRADEIYGEGTYKVIDTRPQREVLNV
jgi:hypothetical protein